MIFRPPSSSLIVSLSIAFSQYTFSFSRLFLGKRFCRVEILKNPHVAGMDWQRQRRPRAFQHFVLFPDLCVLSLL